MQEGRQAAASVSTLPGEVAENLAKTLAGVHETLANSRVQISGLDSAKGSVRQELQTYEHRSSKLLLVFSNMLRKLDSTDEAIVANLK